MQTVKQLQKNCDLAEVGRSSVGALRASDKLSGLGRYPAIAASGEEAADFSSSSARQPTVAGSWKGWVKR